MSAFEMESNRTAELLVELSHLSALPASAKAEIRESLDMEKLLQMATKLLHSESTELQEIGESLMSLLPAIEFSSLSEYDRALESVLGLTDARKWELTATSATTPSAWFTETIHKIETGWNLHLERGKQVLIQAYLMEARRAVPSLIVFVAHHFSMAPIKSGTWLHGHVDYMVAHPNPAIGASRDILLMGQALPLNPVLVVVVAKSDEAFGAGVAQTLGTMMVARADRDTAIMGALTDGLRWIFLRLNGTVYDRSPVLTHQHQSMHILDIMRECLRGTVVSLSVVE